MRSGPKHRDGGWVDRAREVVGLPGEKEPWWHYAKRPVAVAHCTTSALIGRELSHAEAVDLAAERLVSQHRNKGAVRHADGEVLGGYGVGRIEDTAGARCLQADIFNAVGEGLRQRNDLAQGPTESVFVKMKRQFASHALVAVGDQAAADLGDGFILAAHVQLAQVVDGDTGLSWAIKLAGIPGGDQISSGRPIDDIYDKSGQSSLGGAPPASSDPSRGELQTPINEDDPKGLTSAVP